MATCDLGVGELSKLGLFLERVRFEALLGCQNAWFNPIWSVVAEGGSCLWPGAERESRVFLPTML